MRYACNTCGVLSDKPWCPAHPPARSPSSKTTSHRRHKARRAKLLAGHMVCHICGQDIEPHDLHADHVIPLSRGGPDNQENVRPSHAACNQAKGDSLFLGPPGGPEHHDRSLLDAVRQLLARAELKSEDTDEVDP